MKTEKVHKKSMACGDFWLPLVFIQVHWFSPIFTNPVWEDFGKNPQ
jgi:hypothetical protein